MPFELHTTMKPQGSQPEAIKNLISHLKKGKQRQVLLGITGSGKTFTMANVINQWQKPTLILAHNKTLAGQLYQEFSYFFPNNRVEYFVSYYDYYQPEAYIARSDTYIEKDLAINDQIERMRLSTTRALTEREDVIVISSVSCIYGLGDPAFYKRMRLHLSSHQELDRDVFLQQLIDLHYKRHHNNLMRGGFRVRGDAVEVVPGDVDDIGYRIIFFGNEIESIEEIDPLTSRVKQTLPELFIYPSSHYVTPKDTHEQALRSIQAELQDQVQVFESKGQLVEKTRIHQRTVYDMELIKETGTCKGIENYSRHFSNRSCGEPSFCLLDYFPKDFLMFIDESHVMVPQVRAMYHGDRSRKKALVEFGFRLPSAYDNRPLTFDEFYTKLPSTIFVSATPASWELEESTFCTTEQIIRPTGLLDPKIEIKSATSQVDDCLEQISIEVKKNRRVLVTVLTKHLAEELAQYLQEIGVKAKYLHSSIDTLERMQILKELRAGTFDILVGINLLREGLDIPEVSLVCILDADKEGFLRSETALIQTCGRASRNSNGRVILYADKHTDAIKKTIIETERRRKLQVAYNTLHNITPQTAKKRKNESLMETFLQEAEEELGKEKKLTAKEIEHTIRTLEKNMKHAAKHLEFEKATQYRDLLKKYKQMELLEDSL